MKRPGMLDNYLLWVELASLLAEFAKSEQQPAREIPEELLETGGKA